MLRVSFSPAPGCVVADCWNRAFPTPPCHQATVVVIVVVLYLNQIARWGTRFLEGDLHYTKIFRAGWLAGWLAQLTIFVKIIFFFKNTIYYKKLKICMRPWIGRLATPPKKLKNSPIPRQSHLLSQVANPGVRRSLTKVGSDTPSF